MIAGHIHTAEMRNIEGIAYYSDGDWVRVAPRSLSITTVLRKILHWAEDGEARKRSSVRGQTGGCVTATEVGPVR